MQGAQLYLVHDGCASVHDDRADACLVGELAGLVVDLGGQLARGAEHQCHGVRLPAAPQRLHVGLEDVGDDREAEGGRLAGARLRASHQVAVRQADGDGVLLHWCGLGVVAAHSVGCQCRGQVGIVEAGNWVGHLLPRGLDLRQNRRCHQTATRPSHPDQRLVTSSGHMRDMQLHLNTSSGIAITKTAETPNAVPQASPATYFCLPFFSASSSARTHRNVVVGVEVDPRVLLREHCIHFLLACLVFSKRVPIV